MWNYVDLNEGDRCWLNAYRFMDLPRGLLNDRRFTLIYDISVVRCHQVSTLVRSESTGATWNTVQFSRHKWTEATLLTLSVMVRLSTFTTC